VDVDAGAPRSRVVLGVSGGIAAYKACEVLRGLTESGCDVTVVPTAAALSFVGAATWSALSGKPVATDVWQDSHRVPHVRLGQEAEAIVVAPATADLLARATHGIADDLLTNVLLTARCPVVLAPAMHTEMWEHPATRRNVALLRERGMIVLEPDSGRLTGADSGKGRLPQPSAIVSAVLDILRRQPTDDLRGLRIAISAGGTREAWDPVRFVGNHSSGRQGVELARTALARGAIVTLVAAHMDVGPPAGVEVVRVSSAAELEQAMQAVSPASDVVVMAAAVADFRPLPESTKVKKDDSGEGVTLSLERTPDVLAGLVAGRTGSTPFIVGFAAETAIDAADLLVLGQAKLARKGCDLLVVNDVGADAVFGSADNAVVILAADGSEVELPRQGKAGIADGIWDAVAARLRG
jgi:phosphopantothenoylcysteine decarboxylase/phosphopantothenate--cysteine ligase